MDKKQYKKSSQDIIGINGIYLTNRYYGSGFSSYLANIINQIKKNKTNFKYLVFLPIAIERMEKSSNLEYLIIKKKESCQKKFLLDIQNYIIEKRLNIKKIFLPQLEDIPSSLQLEVFLTIHDIIPTLFLSPTFLFKRKTPLKLMTLKGLGDFFLIKKIAKKVKKIITISQTSRKDIIRFFPNLKNKINILPPFINPKFKKYNVKQIQPLLKKFNLTYKSYFIYFGGHTQRKNFKKFLNFFLNNFHYFKKPLIVIDGKASKSKLLKKDLSNKKIILVKKLSINHLTQMVAGAKFSFYPSLYEGYGMPVMESILAGTLPLSSNIPSIIEITNGLLPTFNSYTFSGLLEIVKKYYNQKKQQELIKKILLQFKVSHQADMLKLEEIFK